MTTSTAEDALITLLKKILSHNNTQSKNANKNDDFKRRPELSVQEYYGSEKLS